MNTYGKTSCPNCGTLNNMYRSLDLIKKIPQWNKVLCWGCAHEYNHTDKLNNIKSEAEKAKEEGRY